MVEWLDGELARQAGLSSASISLVMTGQQGPGIEFCRGVAEALLVPPDKVFRLAGLLPPVPERDERTGLTFSLLEHILSGKFCGFLEMLLGV